MKRWLDYLNRLAAKLSKNRVLGRIDRLHYFAVFIFLLNVLVLARLFYLQVDKGAFYSALAASQQQISEKLLAKRGEIFVQDDGKNVVIATNKDYITLYAIPKELEKPAWTAKILSEILGLDQVDLEKKLSKPDDPYEVIKKKLTDDEVNKVKDLKIDGLAFVPETGRFYPDKDLMSQITGFLGQTQDKVKGLYGIEGYWDTDLTGKQGQLKATTDLSGNLIASSAQQLQAAQDGSSIVLTIDRTIQYYVCSKLAQSVKDTQSTGGTVIIMEPQTGKIIAMCSEPSFDPNHYNEVTDPSLFNNPATFGDYEPGSTFKVITMAAGLDTNTITPDTTYTDEGFVKIGPFTIKNALPTPLGVIDMITVLRESLNTGAIFVSDKLGLPTFNKYVADFGFGVPTGIELDSETKGNLSSLNKKGQVYLATASFGQGITVTPIQMVTAYAAVANAGKLMKPYIVDKVIKSSGETMTTIPQAVRQVISDRAATLLTGMMVSAIKDGHGHLAGVPGYLIAGKTGTAQVANTTGGGYSADTIHSLIGFGPVDNPRFAMLVKLDRPKLGGRFAESTAAPLFGDIAKFILNYWEIKPTQ